MKRLAPLLCLSLLVGCVPPDEEENQGIAVGNPGVVAMSLAEAEEWTVTVAEASVEALGWKACSGADRLDTLQTTLDLTAEPTDLSFPAGDWCGVVVRFAGPVELEATWSDGVGTGSLAATVTLPELQLGVVDDPLAVDEDTAWALELASPDWLDAAALGVSDGVDVTVEDAEDALHAVLVAAFTDETALFDDADGSGHVESAERDAGAAALPMELAFNPDPQPGGTADAAGMDPGCSCATGGSTAGGAWMLLALLALRTRRRRLRAR